MECLGGLMEVVNKVPVLVQTTPVQVLYFRPPILDHRFSIPHGLSFIFYVFYDTLKRHKLPTPRHFTTK